MGNKFVTDNMLNDKEPKKKRGIKKNKSRINYNIDLIETFGAEMDGGEMDGQ